MNPWGPMGIPPGVRGCQHPPGSEEVSRGVPRWGNKTDLFDECNNHRILRILYIVTYEYIFIHIPYMLLYIFLLIYLI